MAKDASTTSVSKVGEHGDLRQECDGSDDPRLRCGLHHDTGLACVGGSSCCCGEPWRRGNRCSTGAKTGDVVSRRDRVYALIDYAALEGDNSPDQVDSLTDAVLAIRELDPRLMIADGITWLIAAGCDITVGATDHQGGAQTYLRLDLDDEPTWYGPLVDILQRAKERCEAEGITP